MTRYPYRGNARALFALQRAAEARRRAFLEHLRPGFTGETMTHHLLTAYGWLVVARGER